AGRYHHRASAKRGIREVVSLLRRTLRGEPIPLQIDGRGWWSRRPRDPLHQGCLQRRKYLIPAIAAVPRGRNEPEGPGARSRGKRQPAVSRTSIGWQRRVTNWSFPAASHRANG